MKKTVPRGMLGGQMFDAVVNVTEEAAPKEGQLYLGYNFDGTASVVVEHEGTTSFPNLFPLSDLRIHRSAGKTFLTLISHRTHVSVDRLATLLDEYNPRSSR